MQLTLINKVESVQCCSACFILNNYEEYSSVTNMLRQLDLPPLSGRRTCNHIIRMAIIFKNAVHIPVKPPILPLTLYKLEDKATNSTSNLGELTPMPFPTSLMLLNFEIIFLH